MGALKRSRPARTRVRCRVELRGSRQSFVAEARDLSTEGICLLSPIRLGPGDRVGASLRFRGGLEVSLSFEVRWIRLEGADRYLLGAEFVHTPETRKAMRTLIWRIESGSVKGDDPDARSPLPAPFLPRGIAPE